MKWLEGWFGTASGVLGVVWVALVAMLIPVNVQTSGGSCTTSGDVTTCTSSYGPGSGPVPTPQPPDIGLLIVLGVTILLFAGVLVGTWLDLRGARRVGRIILLTSATLLMFASVGASAAKGAPGGIAVAFTLPLMLLAFTAGVLACVRSDAPRNAVAAPME